MAGLCRALEREGWIRNGSGPIDPWYRLTFRRSVGAPRPQREAEDPEANDIESQPVLTLVPVKKIAEPVEAAVAEEPAEAQPVPLEQAAEPVEAAPSEVHVTARPVAVEETEHRPAPDEEPLENLGDDVAEPQEDIVIGPWYRQPPRPAPDPALTAQSDLCSRIGVYVARAG